MSIFRDDASNVQVSATFPKSNPLGQIINGEQNSILLHISNPTSANFTVLDAAGSYHDVNRHWALMRNTSALKYDMLVPAGANISVPFRIFSEFKPQPIGLTIWTNIQDVSKDTHRYVAYNSTVEVVEPQGSWFDLPLIFLYLVLASILSFGGYYLFRTLQSTYFPPPKRRTTTKKIVVSSAPKTEGYPESVKPYEEEWIPEGLRKREKKVGSGGETSGGEATSGAEGKKKKKGKK